MTKLKLEDNQNCFVCGPKNVLGFRLQFDHPRQGLLKTSVVFQEHHQGFKGIVHGGLMATMLDEVMLNLAWVEGIPAVTGEMTIRLQKPAKTGQPIAFEGYLEEVRGRILKTRALAKSAEGEILATATGTCVRMKIEVE